MMRTAFLLIAVLASVPALAHEIRPAYLRLTQVGASEYTVHFRQPQSGGHFLNLAARTNCRTSQAPRTSTDEHAITETSVIACRQGEPLRRIDIAGLDRTLTDTLVLIHSVDGEVARYVMTPRSGPLDLERTPSTAVPYVALGMQHLLLGLDHLLFVLVLTIMVKPVTRLILAATTFTVAHSITLVAAALGLVSVPQGTVEVLIAVSIVMMARVAVLGAATSWQDGKLWRLTFACGLLHGLGLAGALVDLGLPQSSRLLALALFNVGVEFGQLAAIAGLYAFALVWKRVRIGQRGWLPRIPLYIAGSIAGSMVIGRSIQILG